MFTTRALRRSWRWLALRCTVDVREGSNSEVRRAASHFSCSVRRSSKVCGAAPAIINARTSPRLFAFARSASANAFQALGVSLPQSLPHDDGHDDRGSIPCDYLSTTIVIAATSVKVKSAVLTAGRPLPVCPDQRTFAGCVGMSQRCHLRTLAALRSHAPKQPILLWEM
jgi:hypothetical protein